jgi:hypothetical protein
LRTPRAERLAEGAVDAFEVLTNKASPIIPQLSTLMNDATRPETAGRATQALCEIGTNTLSQLLPVLFNPNHHCRFKAVAYLSEMPCLQDHPEIITPALISCLKDTDISLAVMAARALQQFKAAPELSIPALATGLRSPDFTVRVSAAAALAAFGDRALAAIPALTNALTDPNTSVRMEAGWALHRIAPEQFPDFTTTPASEPLERSIKATP